MSRAALAPGRSTRADAFYGTRLPGLLAGCLVASAVAALALSNGGYPTTVFTGSGALAWWALACVAGLGLWRDARPRVAALAALALLAGLALWTGLSIAWAPAAGRAFLELDRDVLYVGVFALAVLAAGAGLTRAFADGLAVGIVAMAVLSLANRFFPNLLDVSDVSSAFGTASSRLSYPLDYWNGLALFAALGFPLLLRAAVSGRSGLARGAAVAPAPALASVIYMTSSRGGIAVAVVGTLLFVALADRRYRALWAIVAGGAASALAVAVLLSRDELVNDAGSAHLLASQGRSAALLVAGLCVLAGVVHGAGTTFGGERPRPVRPVVRVAVAVIVIALLGAGAAAADPSRRVHDFKQPPDVAAGSRQDYIRAHLLSGGGSGRWQFWGAAVDQFRAHPLAGEGAGSYEQWWARNGTIRFFARDAHSLYLETLGELGLVGALLLLAALAVALGAGILDLMRARDDSRSTIAALLAASAAFMLAAAIDWMWELTAVGAIGVACLGLLAGGAAGDRGRPRRGGPSSRRLRLALRGALALGALLLVACEGIAFLSDSALRRSQEQADGGEVRAALDSARQARAIEPWAAGPYLQLALVREQVGDLRGARQAIGRAVDHDRGDWRLWLTRARISTRSGAIADARRAYLRARLLNPRSLLFETNTNAPG
ncbi:MAG: tetratricopeptide repeat protein [Thermoleophilaceae bacterium]